MEVPKLEGRISFFIRSDDRTSIELSDKNSGIRFIEIYLTNEELVRLLSNEGSVPCKYILTGDFKKLGKILEVSTHDFEISNELRWLPNKEHQRALLKGLAKQTCPEGWEPDGYFGSQSSFFMQNEKYYAKATIRRWV